MSEKGTLKFYFSKQKTHVVQGEYLGSDSNQSPTIDDLCHGTFESNHLEMSSSMSSSLITTVSLDINDEPLVKRSRLVHEIENVDPFKRDPCRGPSFAKEFVLLRPYQPKCPYPTVQRRHFCHEWCETYKWLEYSQINDKAYCFICRFAYDFIKSDNAFTVSGFNCWKNGVSKFTKHESTLMHKQTSETWSNAKTNLLNNTGVLNQIDQQFDKQSEENRLYLKEIIGTIVFLVDL